MQPLSASEGGTGVCRVGGVHCQLLSAKSADKFCFGSRTL